LARHRIYSLVTTIMSGRNSGRILKHWKQFVSAWLPYIETAWGDTGDTGPRRDQPGVEVMVVPWEKCPNLLFVDGLRYMAIETNDRRLRSLQYYNILFPRH
jgi:hypothetical protein